jgi:hypothetical protein
MIKQGGANGKVIFVCREVRPPGWRWERLTGAGARLTAGAKNFPGLVTEPGGRHKKTRPRPGFKNLTIILSENLEMSTLQGKNF